jgi:dCMP deaminase
MTTIPSWDEYFMRHVYLAASKSKDPRTKIGAVLVKNGVLISEGFNGFARKVQDSPERYRDRETKYKFIVHGEANSVLNAARHGINTSESVLYTQGVPCNECAKSLIQAGVREICIHAQWPEMNHVPKWVEAVKISHCMFQEAFIPIRILDKKLGLIGFLDGKEVYV